MGGRGKDVAMREDAPPPRVRVIETSYVMISDPSHFKSVVQSLTGAGQDRKAVGRKRASFGGYEEEAAVRVAAVAGQSTGINLEKRQRSAGAGSSALLKGDSFKEELHRMLAPELPPMEDQNLEWLFSDDDRLYRYEEKLNLNSSF